MRTTSIDDWIDDIGSEPQGPRDAGRLRAIGAALTELERAQANLERAIQTAKDAGESWSAIGVVLGTSRQAAHKRFSKTAASNVSESHGRKSIAGKSLRSKSDKSPTSERLKKRT